MIATPQTILILSTERQGTFWRSESCDECVSGRQLWCPERGQSLLDDAEDEGRRSKVTCVPCALKTYGQQMVVAILCAQKDDWS